MNELFIGMLLVFLDVNIGFNNHIFDILPDFVGYFLMMRGLEALNGKSHYFEKARPVALGMAIYSAVLYAVDALAVTVYSRFLSFCLGILALAASLLLGWRHFTGRKPCTKARIENDPGGRILRDLILVILSKSCCKNL